MKKLIALILLTALLKACASPAGLPVYDRQGRAYIYMGPHEYYRDIHRRDLERYRCLEGFVVAESVTGVRYDLRCDTWGRL
jgi:hypothetical protein